MKPSERIGQIYHSLRKDESDVDASIMAIVKYLDEQAEKEGV